MNNKKKLMILRKSNTYLQSTKLPRLHVHSNQVLHDLFVLLKVSNSIVNKLQTTIYNTNIYQNNRSCDAHAYGRVNVCDSGVLAGLVRALWAMERRENVPAQCATHIESDAATHTFVRLLLLAGRVGHEAFQCPRLCKSEEQATDKT
jgi:hypothetical protein